jgi:hypothetical protein
LSSRDTADENTTSKYASRQTLKALSIIKHHLGPFCQALPPENASIIRKISIHDKKIKLNQRFNSNSTFAAVFGSLQRLAKHEQMQQAIFDNAFDYDSDVIFSETLQAGFDFKMKQSSGETGQ